MPYNYANPMVLGYALANMVWGSQSFGHVLGMVVKSSLEVLTPFGQERNPVALLAPELARPLVHIATNKDWKGAQIHRDRYPSEHDPNAYLGKPDTGAGYK